MILEGVCVQKVIAKISGGMTNLNIGSDVMTSSLGIGGGIIKERLRSAGLLKTLKARFEKNMTRHQGIEWVNVQAKLEAQPEKL